jgi:hypothetical protein
VLRVEGASPMKRRLFFAFLAIAPFSRTLLDRTEFGRKYLQVNGWILKSEDVQDRQNAA